MKSLSAIAPTSAPLVEEDRKSVSSLSSCSSRGSRSSSCSLPGSTVDGNKIRSRLLTTLGIVQQQPQQHQRRRAPATMLRKVAPFSVPLKYDDDEKAPDKEDDTDAETGDESSAASSPTSTTSSTRSSSSSTRKSVVAFDNEVSVVPIPKHQEYSNRIRSRLWCDKRELRSMAARNTLEYQAEGWHPSTVVEDEGFITMASGERIHPVHLHRLLSSPFSLRQPMKVMQLRPPMDVRNSRHQGF